FLQIIRPQADGRLNTGSRTRIDNPDGVLPLWIEQIRPGFGSFFGRNEASVVDDHVWSVVDREPVPFRIVEARTHILHTLGYVRLNIPVLDIAHHVIEVREDVVG